MKKARGARCPPNLLDPEKFAMQVKLTLRGRRLTIRAAANAIGIPPHVITGAVNGHVATQVQYFLRLRAWLKNPSEAPRKRAIKKGYSITGKPLEGTPASNMWQQMAFELITPPPWVATHAKGSLPRCRSKKKR